MAAGNTVPFSIGDEVRRLRLAAGFKSQHAFAEAMGVSRSTVSYWETSEREPTISQYRRMLEMAGQGIHLMSVPLSGSLHLFDPDEPILPPPILTPVPCTI